MVKIRLRRMGAKKAPFYRVVVADSRSPRDGSFIEEIGTYNPMLHPAEIKIDVARAEHWIKNGAQPTDTVRHLLRRAGEKKAAAPVVEVVAEPVVEVAVETEVAVEAVADTDIIAE
jgi:small subunit ribosomal protein S16